MRYGVRLRRDLDQIDNAVVIESMDAMAMIVRVFII